MLNPKSITARAIMNEDLVTLSEDASVDEAISALEDYHISGAPVINGLGECVGVFSTTDVLKRREEVASGETPRAGDYFSSDPFSEDADEYFSKEDYDEVILGKDTVGQWMTPDVKSVPPEASLEDVCKRMARERIHRLLVMEGPKLRGIITSFDIVRLLAGLGPKEGVLKNPMRPVRSSRRAR